MEALDTSQDGGMPPRRPSGARRIAAPHPGQPFDLGRAMDMGSAKESPPPRPGPSARPGVAANVLSRVRDRPRAWAEGPWSLAGPGLDLLAPGALERGSWHEGGAEGAGDAEGDEGWARERIAGGSPGLDMFRQRLGGAGTPPLGGLNGSSLGAAMGYGLGALGASVGAGMPASGGEGGARGSVWPNGAGLTGRGRGGHRLSMLAPSSATPALVLGAVQAPGGFGTGADFFRAGSMRR